MFLFFKIFITEFIAEMGDKTQLTLVGMASRYRLRDIIIGTASAILLLNGIAVFAGGFVSSLIPVWLMKIIAAGAFIFFAVSSLFAKKDEDEGGSGRERSAIAAVAVFATFFLAEFGDKTQLTAITFGANEGIGSAVVVWLACSAGLFSADVVGMVAGYFLHSRLPERAMNVIAFFLFAIFGVITLYQGILLLPA